MVEGGLKDGRMKERRIWMGGIWSSYAPGWPSYAPVWGVTADLIKKRPKFGKIIEIASK